MALPMTFSISAVKAMANAPPEHHSESAPSDVSTANSRHNSAQYRKEQEHSNGYIYVSIGSGDEMTISNGTAAPTTKLVAETRAA